MSRKRRHLPSFKEFIMNWVAPIVEEICVGMEVTSYESAEVEF
ncbi:MAG: pyrroloquinoline quinone precursor peptide PqqA [Beijerinckiaceae bacterium]|nr:pyrroloquinoline quinone precursor peptide PqqA [Beijerinckiaceae bacterium]